MKKVVCTACGLVNLERFVTYPNCAGCGARLQERALQSFWRRGLGARLWVSIVGVCCVILATAMIALTRDSTRRDDAQLLVYVQVPHSVIQGGTIATQFHIDTVQDSNPSTFEDVRLRLSREVLNNFSVLSVEPPPGSVFNTNGGRYYVFGELLEDTPMRLVLRARRAGEMRFNAQVYVRDFYPFDCRSYVTVTPSSWSTPRGPIMPTNKDEDKALAKACRSAIARSPLDISELNIRATGSYIELEGKVRAPRGTAGHVAVRKEFEALITICRAVRGVKDASGNRVTIIEG